MTTTYLPSCEGPFAPVDVACFVVAFIFFAVPVGYVFGLVPALLAGALYCGALTAVASMRPGVPLRACLGAISGGLVGGVWFHAVIGLDSHGYAWVAALVAALLSLRRPSARTGQFSLRENLNTKLHSGMGMPLPTQKVHATDTRVRRGERRAL
jgi:hypothetical protein